jgi:hypothetical protein
MLNEMAMPRLNHINFRAFSLVIIADILLKTDS